MSRMVLTTDGGRHLSLPVHGSSMVTCLIFSHGRIISASDDNTINVYSTIDGHIMHVLRGHYGGVWDLAVTNDTLASCSLDTTVRIWNLATGRCMHVFGGHTRTVRCLIIVEPELVDVGGDNGTISMDSEQWPKRPMVVSGSRDFSLYVWNLPRDGEPEYKCSHANGPSTISTDNHDNPYFKHQLQGHESSVRVLAARSRMLVSGSYDASVRVWDIITGKCKWVLRGHKDQVYSLALDSIFTRAYSGSKDNTIRVWNLQTGQCQHTLTGHTSIVIHIGLSPSYLVSASLDATIRFWDIDTNELRYTLPAHASSITCLQHDDVKMISGSNEVLRLWSIRRGRMVRDLLIGTTNMWRIAFEDRWCAAASTRDGKTMLDIWDFSNDPDWLIDLSEGTED